MWLRFIRKLAMAAMVAAVVIGPIARTALADGVNARTGSGSVAQRLQSLPNSGKQSPESLLFVTLIGKKWIDVFNSQGRKIREIRTGAVGEGEVIATDGYRDLFVADGSATSAPYVDEYEPPYDSRPVKIYVPGTQGAWGVAADARTGVLAIFSFTLSPPYEPYFIAFYRHGSAKPCNVVSTKGSPLQTFDPVGFFDSEGTLFFNGYNGKSSVVASLPGECSAKTVNLYSFAVPTHNPSVFAVDGNDNVVISTEENHNVLLYSYKHPKGGVFASPIAATWIGPYGGHDAGPLTFAGDGRHIWAASGAILLYRYPGIQTTAPVLVIPNVQYAGQAAVAPPLVP